MLYLLGHAVFRLLLGLGSVRHAVICGALVLVLLPVGLVSGVLLVAGVIVAFLTAWVVVGGGVRPILRAWRAGQTPSMHSG